MSDSSTDARPQMDAADIPTAVTARMYVNLFTKSTYQDGVKLTVAYQNGHNKEWAAATPTGSIDLGLGKANGASRFFEAAMEAGDDLEIVFRRVPREG